MLLSTMYTNNVMEDVPMDIPLIGGTHHPAPSGVLMRQGEGGDDYPPTRTFRDIVDIWCIESTKLWSIACPIAFNILCNYGISSFTSIFVGHIGDIELSAVSIGISIFGSFSFGFLLGMGSALETLCGQAFGAGEMHMLGVYTQRSWLILLGAASILTPLYLNARQILLALGQDSQIAELAGKFSIQCIPQMFSFAINFPSQKFLQAQSKVAITACIGFVALMVHVLLLYMFVIVFGWGVPGAALAFNVSSWGIAIAQVVYIMVWCKDTWHGFSWQAFQDIWPFVRLSIASAVMTCLEVWYFMILIVLTGQLDDPVISIGSLSICANLNQWEGMLFLGINAAISVRVSNELGAGRPRAAKFAVIITIVQSLCIGIICMCIIMLTKDDFAVIFTNSKEMQNAVSHLAYLVGITMVLNSLQPVISGVAVGGGWQALVAYINLFCYYAVGLPFGFLLGYKGSMGVEGIWKGMICGVVFQSVMLVFVLYKTNWNNEVKDASERIRFWRGQIEESNESTMSSIVTDVKDGCKNVTSQW